LNGILFSFLVKSTLIGSSAFFTAAKSIFTVSSGTASFLGILRFLTLISPSCFTSF